MTFPALIMHRQQMSYFSCILYAHDGVDRYWKTISCLQHNMPSMVTIENIFEPHSITIELLTYGWKFYFSSSFYFLIYILKLPGGSDSKETACNAGDPGSIPGLGRSPGEGNANPFPYSCLGNPINRAVWRATVCGVTKESDTTEQITHTNTISYLNFFYFRLLYWIQSCLQFFCCVKMSQPHPNISIGEERYDTIQFLDFFFKFCIVLTK